MMLFIVDGMYNCQLVFRSMINIPEKAIQLLIEIADSNFNKTGEHVETLAFFLAINDGIKHVITDVVLPTQSSSGSFVEDHGIDEEDTSVFLQNMCFQDTSKFVLGWFHTHVRGTPLMLSAVDCHTQFLYETAVFTGIKSFVLHIPSRDLECYELTDLGLNSVRMCTLQSPEKATTQHLECFQGSFYRSLKHLLVIGDYPFTFTDARKTHPFSNPSGSYEKFLSGIELPTI